MNKKVLITEVCDILVGRTPSRYNPLFWGEGFPWLSIADMNQGELLRKTKESITELAVKECNCKLIPKNTVLFSFKLSIGKVGISAIDIFTNEAIAAFRIKDIAKLDTKYLFYTLKSTDYSVGSNKAVMGKTLNKEQLKKFTIPLPSIEEQHRIVKTLDLAQSLIEKRKQAIAYLDDYIKAVFLDMFGDPVSNPKGWEVKKLGDLVNEFKYGTNQISDYNWTDLKLPILRIPNIIGERINYQDLKYSIIEEKEKEKIKLIDGDLLFVRSNGNPAYIGRCAVFEGKFECGYASYLIRARLKSEESSIYPLFLRDIISFPTYRNLVLKKAKTTAGNYNINIESLKSLEVYIPPKKLQDPFLAISRLTESLKHKMLSQLKELENNFQAELQRAFGHL